VVFDYKRYPLSGWRFVPLFLDIQGEQRCYGSLPDNVIFKADKRDCQNTLVRVLFDILNWYEIASTKSIHSYIHV